jgi:DNA repair protein RadC
MTEPKFWEDLKSGKFARMVKEEAKGHYLTSSREVYHVMKPLFAELDDVETFYCLFLDSRNRIISIERLFTGTLTLAAVYPREIVKRVIALKASGVVLAHNHPSGSPTPSQEDMRITRAILFALSAIDVQVHDHIVVAEGFYSMADHGWIKSCREEFKNIIAC